MTKHSLTLKNSLIVVPLRILVLLISCVYVHAQSREFLFNNGVNYMLADKNKAIQQFTRTITVDSTFTPAYLYRGMAYFKLGKYDSAIMDFDRVYEIDSSVKVIHAFKGFAYRQVGDNEKSLAAFDQYMHTKNNLSPLDYKILGRAKLQSGDVHGAIENFESAVDEKTGESAYYYLFQALFANGDYAKAMQQINLAIAENKEFYGYYINRGNTFMQLGKFDDALNDYDYALYLEPSVPDSYFLRGWVLDTLKQHEIAIRDFTRAIEMNPNDGTYYSKRGNARNAMGQRDAACLDWTIANNLGYYKDFDKIKSLCK